jgi:hypothetical protein
MLPHRPHMQPERQLSEMTSQWPTLDWAKVFEISSDEM